MVTLSLKEFQNCCAHGVSLYTREFYRSKVNIHDRKTQASNTRYLSNEKVISFGKALQIKEDIVELEAELKSASSTTPKKEISLKIGQLKANKDYTSLFVESRTICQQFRLSGEHFKLRRIKESSKQKVATTYKNQYDIHPSNEDFAIVIPYEFSYDYLWNCTKQLFSHNKVAAVDEKLLFQNVFL